MPVLFVSVMFDSCCSDLLKNPLIVPVKILKGHKVVSDLGVLCCEFHPTQPWLFSSKNKNALAMLGNTH